MLPYNKHILSAILGIPLLVLTGCVPNYILDPVKRDYVALTPGDEWDPSCSTWYCPKTRPISPLEEITLPDPNCELDISEILDIALRNHPQTKHAWELARAQAFQVGVTEAAYYPTVFGSENLVFNDITARNPGTAMSTGVLDPNINSNVTTPGTGNSTGAISNTSTYSQSWVSNLNISYLVFDFGGRQATIEAARHALYALDWTQNRVIQQVLFNVAQTFYAYIDAKEQLIAKQEDLKNTEMNLEAARELHLAGIVPRLDLLQAEATNENAILALVTARNQVKIAMGALATAVGVPASSVLDTRDLPEQFPVDDITMSIEELMETAKLKRPDLAAAWETVHQQQMNVIVAKSESLPTVTSNVFMQQTNFLHRTGIDGHFFSGAISLNIPIFSGWLYENQIREAQENVRAARANYDNLENQALLEVVNSFYTFQTAKESLKYSEQYLKFAQEAYDLAFESYRMGTQSILNLLQAQATLSDARALRIDYRANWAISLFNVALSTGTLSSGFVQEKVGPCLSAASTNKTGCTP